MLIDDFSDFLKSFIFLTVSSKIQIGFFDSLFSAYNSLLGSFTLLII